MVEKRAADEESTLVALHLEIASVHHELRAFGYPGINIVRDLLEMLRGDQRTHLGIAIRAGADLEGPYSWLERRD